MSFIEIHEGCNNVAGMPRCWAPQGRYITIFSSELRYLIGHFLIALILGLLTMNILYRLNKKNKINFSSLWIIIVSILTTLFLFLLFAFLLPIRMIY